MKILLRIIFISTFLVQVSYAGVNFAKHNYLMAGNVSKQFMQHLFIEENYKAAFDLMHEDFKKQLNLNQLKELLSKVHKGVIPKKFEIVEFEIYSGQEFISIFINTKNNVPSFFYRVTLSGNKDKGYLVAGFHIAAKKIPEQGRRLPYKPVTLFGSV